MMPDRRMIHRKITVSTGVADLIDSHGPAAGLFWTWLIPFYDRYGCVPDDPGTLKSMVCPRLNEVTADDLKRWVAWLVRRKMLVRVKGPNGDRGLRNPHFADHQRGVKFDRETPSPYEPTQVTKQLHRDQRKTPPKQGSPDLLRTKSGSSPPKGREGKVLQDLPPSPTPSPEAGVTTAPPPPSPGARAEPSDQDNGNGTTDRFGDLRSAADVLTAMRQRDTE